MVAQGAATAKRRGICTNHCDTEHTLTHRAVMTLLVLVLVLGFVPMIVWTACLWWIDHWEREPWYLIMAAFAWGAVPSVVLAYFSQMFIASRMYSADVFYDPQIEAKMAVVVAPVTEEILKALALLIIVIFRRRDIDSLMDGFIYGAAVGFGFAAAENILYFHTSARWGGVPLLVPVVITRSFVFGTNHAIFAGMTGLGFAMARFKSRWWAWLVFPCIGLLVAMFLHGLHNYLVIWSGTSIDDQGFTTAVMVHAIAFVGCIALFVTSLLVQRHWVRHYLQEEVELGVLTASQLHLASRIGKSYRIRGESKRFCSLCVKLAMKKHMHARAGEKEQDWEEIQQLRQEIREKAALSS